MNLFEFDTNAIIKGDGKEEEKLETKVEETQVEDVSEGSTEEVEETPETQETVEEIEEVETDTADDSSDPVRDTYQILQDFLPLNDIEDLDEEKLRQTLENDVPQTLFMSFVESKPQAFQELLTYSMNFTDEEVIPKMQEYFNKYMKPKEVSFDLETDEGARKYLSSNEEFTDPFLGDEEDMNMVLDRWEDSGKLIEKAKSYQEKISKRTEQQKKQDRLEAENQAKLKQERELKFKQSLRQEIDSMPWSKEMKTKTISALNPKHVNHVNEQVKQSPKAIAQLANIYSYFEDGSFDKLFEILEGKKQSGKAKEVKERIVEDSLAKRLNRNSSSTASTRIKGFVPQLV